jgi:hypothetical protein
MRAHQCGAHWQADVDEHEPWRTSPTAPCGCEWDGYHCPHCGSMTTHGGDAWEPRHTLTCHRPVRQPAFATGEEPPVDDDF